MDGEIDKWIMFVRGWRCPSTVCGLAHGMLLRGNELDRWWVMAAAGSGAWILTIAMANREGRNGKG